jgi:cytochrome oxidase Cu insertion factor (SCO1/SenC/PrrC family)
MRWAVWGAAALIGLGAGIALFVLRSSSPSASPGIVSAAATTWASGTRRAPAVALRDQNGKAVSLASFRGRTVILTFLDPLCRSYCPIEAARLGDVVRSIPAAHRPAIIAVSVNVHGNARRYLLQDMHKWDVGPGWHWGVGTPKELGSVWNRYDIGVLDQTKKIAGVVVHNITHTEAAYVVDPNGYERALFLWPFTAADMRTELGRLS